MDESAKSTATKVNFGGPAKRENQLDNKPHAYTMSMHSLGD
jgi:hypothetical protein